MYRGRIVCHCPMFSLLGEYVAAKWEDVYRGKMGELITNLMLKLLTHTTTPKTSSLFKVPNVAMNYAVVYDSCIT